MIKYLCSSMISTHWFVWIDVDEKRERSRFVVRRNEKRTAVLISKWLEKNDNDRFSNDEDMQCAGVIFPIWSSVLMWRTREKENNDLESSFVCLSLMLLNEQIGFLSLVVQSRMFLLTALVIILMIESKNEMTTTATKKNFYHFTALLLFNVNRFATISGMERFFSFGLYWIDDVRMH